MNLLDILTLWPPFSSSVALVLGDPGAGGETTLYAAILFGAESGASGDANALVATLAAQADAGTGSEFATYVDVSTVRAPATGILVMVQAQTFAEEGAAPTLTPVYSGGFCERGILGEPGA